MKTPIRLGLGVGLVSIAATLAAQSAGTLTLEVSPLSMPEDGGPSCHVPGQPCEKAVFLTVHRTGGSAGTVTVDLDVIGGTATNHKDYAFNFGLGKKTFTLGPGVIQDSTILEPFVDSLVEGDETVLLGLSNPTGGATLGVPSTGGVTIIDAAAVAGVPISRADLAILAGLFALLGSFAAWRWR